MRRERNKDADIIIPDESWIIEGIFLIIFFLTVGPSLYSLAYSLFFLLQTTFGRWIIFIIAAVSGVFFYYLRGINPILYGGIEISAGGVSIAVATFSAQEPSLATGLALLGGVYVIVRGLDNVEKGLSQDSNIEWRKFFPQRRR